MHSILGSSISNPLPGFHDAVRHEWPTIVSLNGQRVGVLPAGSVTQPVDLSTLEVIEPRGARYRVRSRHAGA